MELILVRHAEPIEETSDGKSPADPPLSDRGMAQARAVAEWLSRGKVDRIISSPSLRARQTATETARRVGLEVTVDDRLRDANAEADRYVPLELEKARDPAAYRARIDAYRDSPRLAGIAHRVDEVLEEWTARCRGERLAAFCHGSVVNVYAAGVLGLERRAFLEAKYASAHRFLVSSKGVRSVQSLNETAYLPT
jgi:probable phosphoglycerate mutase